MSRIGKLPIKLPTNVVVNYKGTTFSAKGNFGILKKKIPAIFNIRCDSNVLYLNLKNSKIRKYRSLYGLYRTLISNMIEGVSEQFKLILKLNGVGYKVYVEKNLIILNVGYSHLIKKIIPKIISVEIIQNTIISLKSCDKEKLGLFAAQLRSYKRPEPYKGKGIYIGKETLIYKKIKLNKK